MCPGVPGVCFYKGGCTFIKIFVSTHKLNQFEMKKNDWSNKTSHGSEAVGGRPVLRENCSNLLILGGP